MRIDWKDVYQQRIYCIEDDIKKAIWAKDWKLKAKLMAELKMLKLRIEGMEE